MHEVDQGAADVGAVVLCGRHEGASCGAFQIASGFTGGWAVMNGKEIELFGDWVPWNGLLVSNTSFTPYLAQSARKPTLSSSRPHSAGSCRKPSTAGHTGQLPLPLGNHQR